MPVIDELSFTEMQGLIPMELEVLAALKRAIQQRFPDQPLSLRGLCRQVKELSPERLASLHSSLGTMRLQSPGHSYQRSDEGEVSAAPYAASIYGGSESDYDRDGNRVTSWLTDDIDLDLKDDEDDLD